MRKVISISTSIYLSIYLSINRERDKASLYYQLAWHPPISSLTLLWDWGKVRCASGMKMRDEVSAVQWRQTELSTGWDIHCFGNNKSQVLNGLFFRM